MCDTLYCSIGKETALLGQKERAFLSSFFGKNSDRHPQEPQAVCIIPRREPVAEPFVSGRKVSIEDKGFSFVLSKPSWLWGGEMGINEKGVAIGNEAVFSKIKPRKDGILGMDILRAALGSSASAAEALSFLCSFVEQYEQGGNGAYKGSLYYNNSFLIADPSECYQLETAGQRWACRRLERRGAISNAYSITTDWQSLDARTAAEAGAGAVGSGGRGSGQQGDAGLGAAAPHGFSFKEHFEAKLYQHFTRADKRRALALSLLDDFSDGFNTESTRPALNGDRVGGSIADFLDILRSHGSEIHHNHMEQLCIHAGGVPPTATTASFVVEYRGPTAAILWFTGTSYPCVSLYKPILLVDGQFLPLWKDYDYTENAKKSYEYWARHKSWIDVTRPEAGLKDNIDFSERLKSAQESLIQIADQALAALVSQVQASDRAIFSILAQEATAVVSGWDKDCGLTTQLKDHENK
ncbi:MAG TPA: carcinine hydrolase/isopenicillin-N N-acyltransferase family protein [Spirochaetales bacterium]|nr:carcinine hydrolase/isopenicillin-N N-acyltransferase family protein [Spirochaetales bacterium]